MPSGLNADGDKVGGGVNAGLDRAGESTSTTTSVINVEGGGTGERFCLVRGGCDPLLLSLSVEVEVEDCCCMPPEGVRLKDGGCFRLREFGSLVVVVVGGIDADRMRLEEVVAVEDWRDLVVGRA